MLDLHAEVINDRVCDIFKLVLLTAWPYSIHEEVIK